MEQRRKIIIPTGADPEETLSTPHFDTEATLSARPVVPLAEPVAPPAENAYALPRFNGPAPIAASSSWKRSTLILIILAAVSVGIVSGIAIGLYQSRKKAPSTIVTQPSVSEQPQVADQPEPQTAQPPRVEQPEQQPQEEAQIPDTPADEPTKSKSTDEDDDDKQVARDNTPRDNPRRDDARVPPPVVRDRPTVDDSDMDERDERRARREERRERRREERREERRRRREANDDDNPLSVPRNIERARQEINRIRDIFEGPQP